jgi:hypothetical protein
MRRDPSGLPRRETAARDLSWASVAGLLGNTRSWMSVQQRYSTGDMCSGAVAVTVPGATRGLDELSGYRQQIARALLQHRCVHSCRTSRAQLIASAFMQMRASIGCTLGNWRSTLGRGWNSSVIERSHACSVCDRLVTWSPPSGGLNARVVRLRLLHRRCDVLGFDAQL